MMESSSPSGLRGPKAMARNVKRFFAKGGRKGLRAGVYVRVATSRPGFRPLREQTEGAKAYAITHEMTLEEVYSDSNSSGMVIHRRPGLLKMLEDAEAGRFDVLLVQDVERLGRGPVALGVLTKLSEADVPAIDITNDRILDLGDVLLAAGNPVRNDRGHPL